MELSEAKQVLLEQLLGDASLSGLLEKCAQLMGAPMRFTFHFGQDGFLLSENYPYADVVRSQIITSQRVYNSDNSFRLMLEQHEAAHGGNPFILTPEESGLGRRLLCIVRAGSQTVGILTLPEYDRPLEDFDQPLMALCARCVGFRMMQAVREGASTTARQGMHLLLSMRGTSYRDLVSITGSSVFPREGAYRLLVLRETGSGGSGNIGVLGSQIARLLSTEWFSFYQQEAAVLFEESKAEINIRREIDQLLVIGDACACLSPVFTDLMDTGLWRQRMCRLPAYRLAAVGALIRFEKWLDWGLFGETTIDSAQMETFIPQEIRAIRDWDTVHGTSYLPTLTMFIHHYGKRKQTAAAMNTHINTINYRLQKMEELFGLDFHAPETPYRAFFGIRLMDYLEKCKT